MAEKGAGGLRIFLQYWLLFALLAGFNFYNYLKKGSRLSLVVAIICAVVFLGWLGFYAYYVRKQQ